MTSRIHDLYLDTKGLTAEDLESFGTAYAEFQRAANWIIGDVAIAAKRVLGEDNYSQVFPEWMSVGLVQRCEGVSRAYAPNARNILASWSQHMQNASKPDRVARLQEIAEKGQTTDESRKANQEERQEEARPRWLLAFDIHYFAHRHYYSGAGVETAMQVSEWVQRTVERLKAKGATDVICAMEGSGSFRRELTDEAGWAENKYKDRPPKPEDLRHQIKLVRELLEGIGFCCVSVDRYEADDVMASAAAQFPGKTTIITADKDLRQCLSDKTNILLDVSWSEDETSGEMTPDYKWLTAKSHTEATGLTPAEFLSAQALMGDNVDGIQGAIGIGEKGAANLITNYGTVEAAIQAAKLGDTAIKPKQAESLIEFESRIEITRKLVTLKTDLDVPLNSTRI